MRPEGFDTESTLLGMLITGLIGIVIAVIKHLVTVVEPEARRQARFRRELQQDMREIIGPVADDVQKLNVRVAVIENELEHDRTPGR